MSVWVTKILFYSSVALQVSMNHTVALLYSFSSSGLGVNGDECKQGSDGHQWVHK
jgi:hypothetical protein